MYIVNVSVLFVPLLFAVAFAGPLNTAIETLLKEKYNEYEHGWDTTVYNKLKYKNLGNNFAGQLLSTINPKKGEVVCDSWEGFYYVGFLLPGTNTGNLPEDKKEEIRKRLDEILVNGLAGVGDAVADGKGLIVFVLGSALLDDLQNIYKSKIPGGKEIPSSLHVTQKVMEYRAKLELSSDAASDQSHAYHKLDLENGKLANTKQLDKVFPSASTGATNQVYGFAVWRTYLLVCVHTRGKKNTAATFYLPQTNTDDVTKLQPLVVPSRAQPTSAPVDQQTPAAPLTNAQPPTTASTPTTMEHKKTTSSASSPQDLPPTSGTSPGSQKITAPSSPPTDTPGQHMPKGVSAEDIKLPKELIAELTSPNRPKLRSIQQGTQKSSESSGTQASLSRKVEEPKQDSKSDEQFPGEGEGEGEKECEKEDEDEEELAKKGSNGDQHNLSDGSSADEQEPTQEEEEEEEPEQPREEEKEESKEPKTGRNDSVVEHSTDSQPSPASDSTKSTLQKKLAELDWIVSSLWFRPSDQANSSKQPVVKKVLPKPKATKHGYRPLPDKAQSPPKAETGGNVTQTAKTLQKLVFTPANTDESAYAGNARVVLTKYFKGNNDISVKTNIDQAVAETLAIHYQNNPDAAKKQPYSPHCEILIEDEKIFAVGYIEVSPGDKSPAKLRPQDFTKCVGNEFIQNGESLIKELGFVKDVKVDVLVSVRVMQKNSAVIAIAFMKHEEPKSVADDNTPAAGTVSAR